MFKNNNRFLFMHLPPQKMNITQDQREAALYQWGTTVLKQTTLPWQPLAGDAGGRRYFRIALDKTYLAVDSPNHEVDNPRFVALAKGLTQAGLHVPTIYATDLPHGFLLINELSTQHYLDVLTLENADPLYHDALSALIQLHDSAVHLPVKINPWIKEDYYSELTDMPVWLLNRHFNLHLSTTEEHALEKVFAGLMQNMINQPQVVVHRDYHSRNLLYCADHNPGIIDFQDLFLGPITYDIVSLLRDAYITWPWEHVNRWVDQFYTLLIQQPKYHHLDYNQFIVWFHGMTLQRGIKVLGRFARLCYRDNKPRYLADLPRVANYVVTAAAHYPGVTVLEDILLEKVLPRLQEGS